MKPTTYYVQTTQIDDLVETYGSRFEEMALENKLALRLALANYVYLDQLGIAPIADGYTLGDAFDEAIADNNETAVDFEVQILPLLEGISVNDAEGLIEAITAQLRAAQP